MPSPTSLDSVPAKNPKILLTGHGTTRLGVLAPHHPSGSVVPPTDEVGALFSGLERPPRITRPATSGAKTRAPLAPFDGLHLSLLDYSCWARMVWQKSCALILNSSGGTPVMAPARFSVVFIVGPLPALGTAPGIPSAPRSDSPPTPPRLGSRHPLRPFSLGDLSTSPCSYLELKTTSHTLATSAPSTTLPTQPARLLALSCVLRACKQTPSDPPAPHRRRQDHPLGCPTRSVRSGTPKWGGQARQCLDFVAGFSILAGYGSAPQSYWRPFCCTPRR